MGTSTSKTWGWKLASNEQEKGSLSLMFLEIFVFFSLTIAQCALLHPIFQHSSSARWTRISLAPLTIAWWSCYPFRPSIPLIREKNIVTAVHSFIMVLRSIEWAFTTDPYYLRTLKTIDDVPIWEKDPPPKVNVDSFGFGEVILWSTVLYTSHRGMRWSWGPIGKGNTHSFAKSTLELIRHQLVMLLCLLFVLGVQDRTHDRLDPTAVLLNLGVPFFPGLNLFAECLLSTVCMLLVSSSIEMFHIMSMLGTYPLYPLARRYGLPSVLTETLNPENYPPQFGPLFDLSSLAHFWGKTWHQKLRRLFLFCGGKPAMAMARFMGASTNVQKMCGVMGVFALSGILHEYPFYVIQQPPQNPRMSFQLLPRPFLFFFLQSFGVILEQFILPHIPKRCARIWTASFLLLTAPFFTHAIFQIGGPLNQYRPLSQWTWLNLVVPVPFAPIFLAIK